MNTPRDILSDLRPHLEIEIQAGRRRAPLDPATVQAFLLGVCACAEFVERRV